MDTVTYEVVGQGHISERKVADDGSVTRRSILCGTYVDGNFVATDLSGEVQEVRDMANEHWTPNAIEAFKLANKPVEY